MDSIQKVDTAHKAGYFSPELNEAVADCSYAAMNVLDDGFELGLGEERVVCGGENVEVGHGGILRDGNGEVEERVEKGFGEKTEVIDASVASVQLGWFPVDRVESRKRVEIAATVVEPVLF